MFSRLIRNATIIGILCLGIAAAQAGPARAAGQIEGFAATASASQAGGHPDLWTSITLANAGPFETAKTLTVELPPGLVAYLNSVPQCSLADLAAVECGPSSQLGLATTRAGNGGNPSFLFGTAPIYAVSAAGGDAYGRLAFTIPTLGFTQSALVSFRAGGDYGLRVELPNLPAAAPLRRLDLTLWGAPADPVHDAARFPLGSEGCPGEVGADCNTEPTASSAPPTPLTGYPRDCSVQPLPLAVSLQTYQDPEALASANTTLTGATGCQFLAFSPSSSVEASASSRTRTSLDLELAMPQEPSIAAPTASSAKSASIDFGGALRLDQAAADAHAVCTAAQAGLGSEAPAACPAATKIGSVRLKTPLVPEGIGGPIALRAGPAIAGADTRVAVPEVAGSAYYGGPAPGGGARVYLLPTGFGIGVKLELLLAPDPESGDLGASIALPEFPVAAIVLKMPAGSGVLRTAVKCGPHTVTSTLVPWSSPLSEEALTQPLNLETGPGATPCPGAPAGVQVGLKPPQIVADGASTTAVSALVRDEDGIPVPGEEVAFSSSDGGQVIGPVTDNEDGTYSALITSSTTAGTAAITATVKSSNPELSASAPLRQDAIPSSTPPPGSPPPAIREEAIPKVAIGKHPPRRTRKHRFVFTFSADVPGSIFFCRLDGQTAYRRCPSPTALTGLAVGGHRLSVYAVAPSGATGVPAVVRFTVLAPKRKPT